MAAPPTIIPIADSSVPSLPAEAQLQAQATPLVVPKPKPTLSQMLRDHTEVVDKQRKQTGTTFILQYLRYLAPFDA
jgi:hypothetical protein